MTRNEVNADTTLMRTTANLKRLNALTINNNGTYCVTDADVTVSTNMPYVFVCITDWEATLSSQTITAVIGGRNGTDSTDYTFNKSAWPSNITAQIKYSGSNINWDRTVTLNLYTGSTKKLTYKAYTNEKFPYLGQYMCFVEYFTVTGYPSGVGVDGTTMPGSIVRNITNS